MDGQSEIKSFVIAYFVQIVVAVTVAFKIGVAQTHHLLRTRVHIYFYLFVYTYLLMNMMRIFAVGNLFMALRWDEVSKKAHKVLKKKKQRRWWRLPSIALDLIFSHSSNLIQKRIQISSDFIYWKCKHTFLLFGLVEIARGECSMCNLLVQHRFE